MSVTVEHARFAEIPLLIARPAGMVSPLPTVLWFHGFGADKEVHLPELCRLAELGLLAVGVDAVGHGQRQFADLAQHACRPPHETPRLFARIVNGTVAEVPALIDRLVELDLTDQQRVGVAGVSMGGCIAYGAIAGDRRLCAAAVLLGSPEWALAEVPELAVERFFPAALLSITAEHDTVVPPAAARVLHEKLEPRYHKHPERLSYREMAGASHFMQPQEWASAVDLASAWLTRFLA
ncbi:MAG: dienelactone hydrolase family protein [Candidatus Accumulibacter sp.]|jgi:pimeloyl-ACP methyl ester carboxylesterase|nr:dienelactone hydrolase family protein [Candidatus Accumulibacter necessarius]